MDLSEKHLTWFAYNNIEDESNSQYGEGYHYPSDMDPTEVFANGSPYLEFASSLFASGVGPVKETVKDEDIPDYLFKYQGANGTKEYAKVYDEESDKYKSVADTYSEDDDWTIPYKYRFYQSYDLEESYILPNTNSKESGYEYNEAGTNAVKDQLIQGRPVQVMYYADQSLPGQDVRESNYLNLDTWAQYTYEEKALDHAVTIVGYDDNYSKSNFLEDHQPPADGAFLVKNSWGSTESEFPNRGESHHWGIEVNGENTGYFWLSYYDKSIGGLESFNYDLEATTDNGYNLDQYNYCPDVMVNNEETTDLSKSSNVFTAEETEELFSVGCQTTVPNSEVTYDIYILGEDADTPEDGLKVASAKETYEYGGYHKCELENNVIIQKGQKYSIVVTQLQPDGKYGTFMNGVPNNQCPGYEKQYYTAVINEGESYYYKNGKWMDFKDVAAKISAEQNGILDIDNFSIKGYALKYNDAVLTSPSPMMGLDKPGDTEKIGAHFKGNLAEDADDTITWHSSDESILSVKASTDSNGKTNDSVAIVTANAYGTAYIYATNPSGGTAIIKVIVGIRNIKNLSAKSGSDGITLTWKSLPEAEWYTVKYTVAGGAAKTKKIAAPDSSFNIKSPNKHAVYKFQVTAYRTTEAGEGQMSETATVYVNQKPSATKIKSLTAKKAGFTVKWKKQSSTGYQIKYSTSKSMKNAKVVTISKNSKVSKKISGLKKGKKYYVKVRTYNKTPDSTLYSKWSSKKAVKTKKK